MNREKQIDEMAMVICENTAISCYETAVEIAEELIDKGYRKASEVAEEIFAEIERLMLDGAIGGRYPIKVINPDKYAELKEKYAEGEG